jgi:DNA-binding XRE family transcriptional regulator
MKPRTIRELIEAKERTERGETAPARVRGVRLNGKGAFIRRTLDPQVFWRDQKAAWDRSIAATRQRLGLSQSEFATLLGISVKTLRHWEQGVCTPSGAARVLLRVAAPHPGVVLEAA